jgi:hypothetical protein
MIALEKYSHCFHVFNDNVRYNKEVTLLAVSKNGSNLKYTSEKLKNDKEIVFTAIKDEPTSFEYASKELQYLDHFLTVQITILICVDFHL